MHGARAVAPLMCCYGILQLARRGLARQQCRECPALSAVAPPGVIFNIGSSASAKVRSLREAQYKKLAVQIEK